MLPRPAASPTPVAVKTSKVVGTGLGESLDHAVDNGVQTQHTSVSASSSKDSTTPTPPPVVLIRTSSNSPQQEQSSQQHQQPQPQKPQPVPKQPGVMLQPPQELYQAEQQHPMNTPWTLGSSDGSLATQLTMMEQQQHQHEPQRRKEIEETMARLASQQSLHHERLFAQPSASVEAILATTCQVLHLDIAELWLRTGAKTHQLVNSHVRPTAVLDESVRSDLVHVYYGDSSAELTHKLSPALCKRAKEARDVVWVTAATTTGARALSQSISNVRTAVAIPVCHEASHTNLTVLLFSMRRIMVRPVSVELLVHMALSAGVASVNDLANPTSSSRSSNNIGHSSGHHSHNGAMMAMERENARRSSAAVHGHTSHTSQTAMAAGGTTTGSSNGDSKSVESFPPLFLSWRELQNVEYLTDGGTSWIHTAVYQGRAVVVKTLKPECQDVVVAIREMEGELAIHCRLRHQHICPLVAAGTTKRGVRFLVLERLDGGTLAQRLGYDTRIRDRRRRFWKKKQCSYADVLLIGRSIAQAMTYCHEEAFPGSMILHRDLKPDNIGFTLDGTVKILDFGLAKVVENASVDSDECYTMSGETGSLRYMAPEVADGLPYNASVDVYSFGIILWELNSGKKPFDGLNRELFYERIVHGGERPPMGRKWPVELTKLVSECWDANPQNRPKFREIAERLGQMLGKEQGGAKTKMKKFLPNISGIKDRHSTWF